MTRVERLPLNFLILAAGLLFFAAVFAQTSPTGFKDTDALVGEAKQLEAVILAPKNYAAAENLIRRRANMLSRVAWTGPPRNWSR